ncbi:MAG TPA: rRNA maturation RNase YbeY [Chitinophagaceae bacterium]
MASYSQSKVCFFFESVKPTLRHRTELKQFIESIFRKERKALKHLNYVFCTDNQLLQINRDYLKHNYFTDIISFDLSETSLVMEGEIYISIDRVRDNASDHLVSFNSELHRVIFHGALHLCGYKDKLKEDKIKMRAMENKYLAMYLK